MDFWLILEWEICSQRQNPVCFPTLTHSWGRGRGSRNSFFKKKARVKFEIDKLGRCCWILEMLQGGQIEEIRIRNQSHCQKAGDTAFFSRCPVGWDTPLTWNLIGLENPEPRAEAKTCSQKRGQGVGEQVDGGCCGLTSIGICMALLEAALCQKVTSVFGTQVNFFLGVGGCWWFRCCSSVPTCSSPTWPGYDLSLCYWGWGNGIQTKLHIAWQIQGRAISSPQDPTAPNSRTNMKHGSFITKFCKDTRFHDHGSRFACVFPLTHKVSHIWHANTSAFCEKGLLDPWHCWSTVFMQNAVCQRNSRTQIKYYQLWDGNS